MEQMIETALRAPAFYWALAPVASISATVALCALFSAEYAWPMRVGITASATLALVLASLFADVRDATSYQQKTRHPLPPSHSRKS